MKQNRVPGVGILAAVCFLAAAALATVALLLTAGLIREYGPAEGYVNLVLQTLPIMVLGLALAAALVWAGRRLLRRSRGWDG